MRQLKRQYTQITSFFRKQKAVVILIALGTVSWSITMIKSGWLYEFGMGFWGPNGHDGVWHIAVIESLNRGSWNIPLFSGHLLQNYHIGFDLLVSILHKLTFIPVSTLYFQVVPIALAVLVGVTSYRFVYFWKKSQSAAWWSTFFVYFGGSWGWIVTLIKSGELGGESMFWSQQSVSTLINPPFALSLVLLFVGLELLVRIGLQNNTLLEILLSIIDVVRNRFRNHSISSKTLFIVISFIFGITLFVKVYAGLLILGALLVAGIYQLIIKKQGIRLLQIFISSLAISLLFFLSVYSQGSSLVWKPFWFMETMMQLSDRLDWPKFAEAMINYRLGGMWIKMLASYVIAFLIFLYGNLGTRLFGEIYVAKRIITKTFDYIDIIIVSIILAGVVIPTFFVQSGTPWNTIQFMYYSLIFMGLLTGITIAEWQITVSQTKRLLSSIILVVLTVPTTYATLSHHYIPPRPPAKISHEELRALRFLSRQPDGVVLTYPYDAELAQQAVSNPPRPLYLYESTAYVSAFSKHDVYLEDEVNLNITGYDWPERKEQVYKFLQTNSASEARAFLRENNIRYIYWINGQRALLGEEQLGIERLFENEEVSIYEVMSE